MKQVGEDLISVQNMKHLQAFTSLPYHLMCAGCYEELADVLTSLQFIQAKLQLGLASELIEDFQANVKPPNSLAGKKQITFKNDTDVLQFKDFIIGNTHHFANPMLMYQLALNEPRYSKLYQEARKFIDSNDNFRDHVIQRKSHSDVVRSCKSTLRMAKTVRILSKHNFRAIFKP